MVDDRQPAMEATADGVEILIALSLMDGGSQIHVIG